MSGLRKPFFALPLGTQAGEPEGTGALRSLESARRRLGGPSSVPSDRTPGALVQALLSDGRSHAGILLWSSWGSCDVWFDDGIARRARSAIIEPCSRPTPEPLLRIEAEVRVFTSMTEGARVRWEREGGLVEGRIAEKCRYGAIVVTADGKVTAVGFRKLWPAVIPAVA